MGEERAKEVYVSLLEIKNLAVKVDDREILKGLDLVVNRGEVHAIMGPNGSGKSTLSHVLSGKPGYEVTAGDVKFEDADLLAMPPDERAARGIFLAFQYPMEVPGVATYTFLRTALNAQRKARGEPELSMPEFMKRVREEAAKLSIDMDMLRRPVNVGFSGGEKKRNEILQMALLQPKLAMLVITHYQRLLNHIVPDVVHVLSRGRIVRTGGRELALELEAKGYAEYQDEAA